MWQPNSSFPIELFQARWIRSFLFFSWLDRWTHYFHCLLFETGTSWFFPKMICEHDLFRASLTVAKASICWNGLLFWKLKYAWSISSASPPEWYLGASLRNIITELNQSTSWTVNQNSVACPRDPMVTRIPKLKTSVETCRLTCTIKIVQMPTFFDNRMLTMSFFRSNFSKKWYSSCSVFLATSPIPLWGICRSDW